MPAKSIIPRKDLIRVAHLLAAGVTQKRSVEELGWAMNRLARCIARLHDEVRREGERHWYSTRETALEWLRMRGACTPAELAQAKGMARQAALEKLEERLLGADHLRRIGRPDQAEQEYLLHLRDDPENIAVLDALGECLVAMGRPGEALTRFAEALALDPGATRIRFKRGNVLLHAGRHQEGMAEMEAAHRGDPDDEMTLAWLGAWRMKVGGDKAESAAYLKHAVAVMQRKYGAREDCRDHCGRVAEVAFTALSDNGYTAEALEVARVAEIHRWNSPKLAGAIKPRERPRSPVAQLFHVLVRARAGARPEHWPVDSVAYFAQYSAAAHNADEARDVVTAALRAKEPPSVQLELEVLKTAVQLFAPQPWAVAGPPQWTIVATCTAPPPEPASADTPTTPEPPPRDPLFPRRPRPRPPPPRRRTGGSYH